MKASYANVQLIVSLFAALLSSAEAAPTCGRNPFGIGYSVPWPECGESTRALAERYEAAIERGQRYCGTSRRNAGQEPGQLSGCVQEQVERSFFPIFLRIRPLPRAEVEKIFFGEFGVSP